VIGKVKDVKRIPIQATFLSALITIFFLFISGMLAGKIENISNYF
jgi:hypothetical protein